MAKTQYLNFIRLFCGIHPQPFGANLQVLEGPRVRISQSLRGDRPVTNVQESIREYMGYWQDLVGTTNSPKFKQTATKSIAGGIEAVEDL